MDSGTIAIIVALVGPLFGYLAAARKMSGRIQTTEASDLWAESASIRQWSSDRLKELNALVARLQKRVDELEDERESLADDKVTLLRRVAELERICHDLEAQLTTARNATAAVRERADDSRAATREAADDARAKAREQVDSDT